MMKRSAKSGGAPSATTASAARRGLSRSTRLSEEQLQNIFLTAGRSLREGQSSKAEDLLRRSIEQHSYEADDFADLKRLLSFTLETVGRYKESLDVVKPFEDEEVLSRLKIETQIKITTQLAVAYNNLNDHPKAVTLLKENLKKAEE